MEDEMTTEVHKAEQIISDLKVKKNELVELELKLAQERSQIAFEAHTGDSAARKRLDQINKTAAMHNSELESLDAAISEAERRLKQAMGEEIREADRANALKLKGLYAELSDLILADDDLLMKYVRNRHREEQLWHEMRSLGWFQTIGQLRANTSRILRTALFQTPGGEQEFHIAVLERRTGVAYVTQGIGGHASLTETINNHIAQRSGAGQKAA
jgi:hypothetical protein